MDPVFSLAPLDPAALITADPGPADLLDCGYRNGSDRMVILRCCGPEPFYLERVIFPFEVLTFQCPPGTVAEVWTHGLGGPELLETLRIEDLTIAAPATATGIDSRFEGDTDSPFHLNPWLQAG